MSPHRGPQAGPAGLLLRLQAPQAIASHAPGPKCHHRGTAWACSIVSPDAVLHVVGTQHREEFKSSGRGAGSILRASPPPQDCGVRRHLKLPSFAPLARVRGAARRSSPAPRETPHGSRRFGSPRPPLPSPQASPPARRAKPRRPGPRAPSLRRPPPASRLPEATNSPRGATAASAKRLRRGRQARRHLPPEAVPHLAAPTATAAALTGEEAAESA